MHVTILSPKSHFQLLSFSNIHMYFLNTLFHIIYVNDFVINTYFLGQISAEGNQLISYTGNLPDLDDISIPELEADNSQECVSPLPDDATLNTPQVEVRSPAYRMRP